MADDKNRQDQRDRLRVASNEMYEIRYLAEKMGVSSDEVKKAIQKVGNNRGKLEEYLNRQQGKGGRP